MAASIRPGGIVFCVEPLHGFAFGNRTLNLRPEGDSLDADAFWCQVRFAYLKGCRVLRGCDYHIGAHLLGILADAGIEDLWLCGMLNVIAPANFVSQPDFLLTLLESHIYTSW